MEIIDIPSSIAKALKYSLRSRASFLLSLLAAILVLGISFDLLYSFYYTRAFNIKDPYYGTFFWAGLTVAAVIFPLGIAVVGLLRARGQTRPFQGSKYGIAIAPFEVISLDPDTLGAASKLQALDVVMSQFFAAVQRIIGEEDWSKDFEFRFLPPYARILSKRDAIERRAALSATVIIWGSLVQQSYSPIRTELRVLGTEVDLELKGSLDPSSGPAQTLELCVLLAAAFSHRAAGEYTKARELFVLARVPADQLDSLSKSNKNVGLIDHFMQGVDEQIGDKRTS
jgi:hypothetical protein